LAAGETLSAVAKHYGISLQQIIDLNPGLDPDHVREGRSIALGAERRSVRYTVQHGDSLTGIAKANEVTLRELERWNPKLDRDHIREGQTLAIYPRKPESLSESMGSPASGQLLHARKLPPGLGYVVRMPERAYATDETVRSIVEAFRRFRQRDPKAPQLFIHDLSLRRGGPMTEHRSHQSGRDADIAYPQKHCEGVCDFRRLSPADLDAARAFALLRYWLEHDMLESVFIDYRLQPVLYQSARAQGASAEQLHRWFQYPNGPGSPAGVIRHFPKHDDHMHVRFACDASDAECRTYRPLLMHTASR
jgi:LysM repeat protein